MSLLPKPSKPKSSSFDISHKDNSGVAMSAPQPKTASLEVNLKSNIGLTSSVSQQEHVSATLNPKPSNSLTLLGPQQRGVLGAVDSKNRSGVIAPAAAEHLKPASSAVVLVKSNSSTLSTYAEQQKVVELTDGNGSTLTASVEQPTVSSTVAFATGNGSTLSASVEQPTFPFSAAACITGNGSTSLVFADQPKASFPTAGVMNDESLKSTTSVEQPRLVSPAVTLTNGDSSSVFTSAAQPTPTFPVAGLTNGNGSGVTILAEQPQLLPSPGTNLRNGNGPTLSVTEERMRIRTISGLGNRPITPSIAEPRSVIQREEWLEAARRSTEYFKLCGSSVPLVWVLTEGNNIPDNAVPFGEDRNGRTLYIARALLEGSLHIGKASAQSFGAVIGYAGKERVVANYEVLVLASRICWGLPPVGSVLVEGNIPRVVHDVRVGQADMTVQSGQAMQMGQMGQVEQMVQGDVDSLKRLAEVKTVIVIDDSLSMQAGNLWAQAREALGGIVDIANQHGSSGADIHFMHWDNYAPNMKSKSEVDALFSRVQPEGEDTPAGAKLGRIIDHYIPLIEDQQSTHEPIVVIVITDGLPTDQGELDRVIVDVANRLDQHEVKHDMFRIQFVQIGTDPAASTLLHILDDDLANQYNIRDIVDCIPYDPAYGVFDTEYMLKILLGGLRKDLDRVAPNVNRGPLAVLSPPSMTLQYERSSPQGLTARLVSASPRPVSPRPVY